MTEQAIDIMEPGHQVSDEELLRIASDDSLREACQDILVIQGELAPKPDTETAFSIIIENHIKLK